MRVYLYLIFVPFYFFSCEDNSPSDSKTEPVDAVDSLFDLAEKKSNITPPRIDIVSKKIFYNDDFSARGIITIKNWHNVEIVGVEIRLDGWKEKRIECFYQRKVNILPGGTDTIEINLSDPNKCDWGKLKPGASVSKVVCKDGSQIEPSSATMTFGYLDSLSIWE